MKQSLQDKAVQNFQNNITYFQMHQSAVLEKLSELETAIDRGYYRPKYEIVESHGYFDVLEVASQKKLYGVDSQKFATLSADSINYSKEENLYKTFKEHPLDIKDTEDIAPILRYIQKQTPTKKLFKQIDKFIFFGVGLGTHIESIDEKISASTYLIVEDDLELFRLSLFTLPYYKIAQHAELIFSVFEEREAFQSSAQRFLNRNFYHNQYIKFFQMQSHSEEKMKAFHIQVVSQSQNLFFYNTILTQYILPLEYITQKYQFLNLLASYKKSKITKLPTILLAAGPSLQKNIQLVKALQERCIVVALSSVLSTLQKHNISPDIVTHMDGFEPSTQHFKKLQSLEFLKNSIFFFSARSPHYIVNLFAKERIFFYENGTNYRSSMGNLSAACVGSTTYLLLLALGVKKLYLIGLDLALDQETGMTHSSDHEFAQELNIHAEQNDAVSFKRELIEVAGNFRASVKTTVEFALSIDSINAASTGFKQEHQRVFNLNDGAKFTNTTTVQPEQIKKDRLALLEKNEIKKELLEDFTSLASSSFTQEELQLLQFKQEHINTLLQRLENAQEMEFHTQEEFIAAMVQLFKELTQNQDNKIYDISLILQEFAKYIYPFLYDFFNTQGVSETTIHTHKLHKLLLNSFKSILIRYRTPLKQTVNMV